MLETGQLTFDPYTAFYIRQSWHSKIVRSPAPLECRIYGRAWPVGGDCAIWSGWNNGKGHPIVSIGGKRTYLHRYSYAQHYGFDIDALNTVDHVCRNRPCFNPYHLENETHLENYRRGDGPKYQFKTIDEYQISEEDLRALAGDWKYK